MHIFHLFLQAKENPTLKDNDFLGTGEKIIVGERNRDVFLSTLSNDIQVCVYVYFDHAHSFCPQSINVNFVIVRIIVTKYVHFSDNTVLESKKYSVGLWYVLGSWN